MPIIIRVYALDHAPRVYAPVVSQWLRDMAGHPRTARRREEISPGGVQGSSAIQLHDQKRSLRKGLLLPNLIQNDSQFLKLEAWRE